MNKHIFRVRRITSGIACLVMTVAGLSLTSSCKENISEDAYAIASKLTASDYISQTDSLSLIKAIFNKAVLGRSSNASTLTSVLSARGNYTVFAPSDRAVQAYMDSILGKTNATVAELDSAQTARIALNCIIDNGMDDSYELADFPIDNSTFPTSNLNDRRLSSRMTADNEYYINGSSKITANNIEVSNGTVHIVDHVVSPSVATLADLIKANPDMRIMGMLLDETHWADSLDLHADEEAAYETANLSYAGTKHKYQDNQDGADYMDKRYIHFTAFVETDAIFQKEWGISAPDYDEASGTLKNKETILNQIKTKCAEILGSAATGHENVTDPSNPVNQFVAYHILDGGMDSKEFVHHFNEWGYQYGADIKNPQLNTLPINVWDYYTTKGQNRGLLKITQLADAEHSLPHVTDPTAFYLNRISTYDDAFTSKTYQELSCVENDGSGTTGLNVKIDISGGSSDNNALNGFFFPIDHILVYSDATRTALSGERIRIDVATMLPELQSNDLRGRACKYFPRGYFNNIMNESQTTYVHYLQAGYGGSSPTAWKDYQGDEFIVNGRYDFVLKLPPVPKTGTYELRMAVSNNDLRSMVQIYWGDDPIKNTPIGLPIDQRETVPMILSSSGDLSAWWQEDGIDESTAAERDRMLKNQGYMRAPSYFTVTDGSGSKPCRTEYNGGKPAIRRVLTTATFDQNKTYYLRFKSVLETDKAQLYLDYFEFVPSNIVNGAQREDIW